MFLHLLALLSLHFVHDGCSYSMREQVPVLNNLTLSFSRRRESP